MALTTAAGKSVTAFTGKAAASFGAKAAGKSVLKALNLTNPLGWLMLAVDIGLLLKKLLFKPKVKPLDVVRHTVKGGREIARYVFGEIRLRLEWTDATTLPGSQYRDNFNQLIAPVSEGACNDILKIWGNDQPFVHRKDPADSTHFIPQAGNQYTLPTGDVQQYNFPTRYAFELWAKFKADGSEMGDFRTTGNALWAVPANRQYNGNPGPERLADRSEQSDVAYHALSRPDV